jgi:hypothetical protein
MAVAMIFARAAAFFRSRNGVAVLFMTIVIYDFSHKSGARQGAA